MADDYLAPVQEAVAAALGVDDDEATPEATLMDDLGMSSTTGLELMLELEESLDIEISVEDLDRSHFATVSSLADYVAANIVAAE